MSVAWATKSVEIKAATEDGLEVTTTILNMCLETFAGLRIDCMTDAKESTPETARRCEELKILATLLKTVLESTVGPVSRMCSFMQPNRNLDDCQAEAVHVFKDLAKTQQEPALAQFASCVSSSAEWSFSKVKSLTCDMLDI